jgi:hypothetical protein
MVLEEMFVYKHNVHPLRAVGIEGACVCVRTWEEWLAGRMCWGQQIAHKAGTSHHCQGGEPPPHTQIGIDRFSDTCCARLDPRMVMNKVQASRVGNQQVERAAQCTGLGPLCSSDASLTKKV